MKAKKILTVIGIILATIVIFMATINIITPKKNVESNPFIATAPKKEGPLSSANKKVPMVAAHRGGGLNNPENTMLAFREAVNTYNVDIIESDLYLTKDGALVYNHDAYIDETCNINGDISLDEVKALCENEEKRHYIEDMTLEELEKYNFGYYFTDGSGQRIYKDTEDPSEKGLQIATVEKLFAEFYETNPDLLFIVEIKNSGENGYTACKILYETLKEYPEYMDQIVVGTFHDEIETELKGKYPELLRGAPTGTAAKFILTHFAGVNLFDNSDFACLQIPTSYDLGITLNLNKKSIITRAHKRNVAVQYWTINDEDEMRELIELGCDCIMTDDPALLNQVLEEYK